MYLRTKQLSVISHFLLAFVTGIVTAINSCGVINFKPAPSNYGIDPIGTPETVTSFVQCMGVCASKYRSCYGIIFNSVTRLCTPGSFLTTSGQKPVQPEESLMSLGLDCDESRGFSVGTFQDVATCFYISKTRQNYFESRELCQASGGQLYTAKVVEKFKILVELDLRNVYIGLDDLNEDGVFVWSDGTPLEPWQSALYFPPGAPTGGPTGELSVIVWFDEESSQILLDDELLDKDFVFACELPDPYDLSPP